VRRQRLPADGAPSPAISLLLSIATRAGAPRRPVAEPSAPRRPVAEPSAYASRPTDTKRVQQAMPCLPLPRLEAAAAVPPQDTRHSPGALPTLCLRFHSCPCAARIPRDQFTFCKDSLQMRFRWIRRVSLGSEAACRKLQRAARVSYLSGGSGWWTPSEVPISSAR
jgi:hypothetical protein